MLLSVSLLNRVFGMPVMQQPSAGMIACFLLVGCMVYAYSFCFSLMTERHTGAMRHWLQRRMSALLVDH